MTNDSPAADPAADVPAHEPEQTIDADVVSYAGAPDECTLSPREASDDRTTTAWITARGDAFVALDEMR